MPFVIFLSVLYRLLVGIRLSLYRKRVFRSRKLPCTVISVGNITLGGTGKTPTVIGVARLLQEKGKRVAVLSRGYGRKNENDVLVVSDGMIVKDDTIEYGDEPVLLASRLPGVAVVVGADRYRAGLTALERFNPDVLLLDDGFQHVRLERDLNILLLAADEPFGNGRVLPAGPLREPLHAIARADVVVLTRAEPGQDLSTARSVIGRYADAQVVTANHVPTGAREIVSGCDKQLSSMRGMPILAFAGIARPDTFFSLLLGLGADVRKQLPFPDHYPYRESDIDDIRRTAAEYKAEMIITTEKDAVRLRRLTPREVWFLRIEQVVHEMDIWKTAVTGSV